MLAVPVWQGMLVFVIMDWHWWWKYASLVCMSQRLWMHLTMKMICIQNRPAHQSYNSGIKDSISPQAVMDVRVFKTRAEDTSKSPKVQGVKFQLYEARNNPKSSQTSEQKLKEQLQKINPKMALAQIIKPSCALDTNYIETKFGKSPKGSFASYKLSFTEDNCSGQKRPNVLTDILGLFSFLPKRGWFFACDRTVLRK